MESNQSISSKTIPYLLAGLLVVLGMLACGPVAQPNPDPFPTPMPPPEARVADPESAVPSEPVSQEQEPTPSPTPTPMPTACVTFETEQLTTERCFVEPTPYPDRLKDFDAIITDAIIESEEKAKTPGGASADPDMITVELEYETPAHGTAILKWVTDRELIHAHFPEYSIMHIHLPVLSVITLSELDGVKYVQSLAQQSEPTTEGEWEYERCGEPSTSTC